mmetsp:Transcript_19706/g.21920  ORF Transcript_19706/g.21920 Transcript_19706/m.21920 type:complete len:431 (-) Transcript_19706:72-1364(-)
MLRFHSLTSLRSVSGIKTTKPHQTRSYGVYRGQQFDPMRIQKRSDFVRRSKEKYAAEAHLITNKRLRDWVWCMSRIDDYVYAVKELNVLKKQGLKPDAFVYNTLIKIAPSAQVFPILNECEKDPSVETNIVTYNTVLGRYDMTEEEIELILSKIKKLNLRMDKWTLRGLIRFYTKSAADTPSMDSRVGSCLREFSKNDVKPDSNTVTLLINYYIKTFKLYEAQGLAEELLESNQKIEFSTFCAIVRLYCKLGLKDNVTSVTHRMVGEGFKVNSFIYTHLIGLHATLKSTEKEVLNVVEDMQKSGFKMGTNTYAALMRYYNAVGRPERTVEYHEHMVKYHIYHSDICIFFLIEAHVLLCNEKGILYAYNFLLEKNLPLGHFPFNVIMQFYLDNEDPHSASTWYDKMVEKKVKPNKTTEELVEIMQEKIAAY